MFRKCIYFIIFVIVVGVIVKYTALQPSDQMDKEPTPSVDQVLREYYSDGTLHKEMSVQQGILHGPTKVFDHEGKLTHREHYYQQKRHGLFEDYFPNGQTKSIKTYQHDYPHGIARTYYADGQIKYETSYTNGYEQGQRRNFNADGSLQSMEEYKGGVLKSRVDRIRRIAVLPIDSKTQLPLAIFSMLGDLPADGPRQTVLPSGKLGYQTSYQGGRQQKEKVFFNEDGQIISLKNATEMVKEEVQHINRKQQQYPADYYGRLKEYGKLAYDQLIIILRGNTDLEILGQEDIDGEWTQQIKLPGRASVKLSDVFDRELGSYHDLTNYDALLVGELYVSEELHQKIFLRLMLFDTMSGETMPCRIVGQRKYCGMLVPVDMKTFPSLPDAAKEAVRRGSKILIDLFT